MKKRILTLLAAVCLLSAVLSGCGDGSQNGMTGTTDQSTANTQTEGPAARAAAGELNVGIAQDLDSSLDPHKTVKAGTREVMFNVFEGLLKPDASGNLNPAVAESYTVSEDHLLYTFKLRAGVKFHNGQEVTPEDVIWSYQRCGDANAPADIIQVAAFANVEMYQEGDDTVCFQLQEPNNEFASYLTTAVLPKDYTEQDTAPVGTGPFKFVSRTAQESVVLERFDDYWGEKPDLTKVTYKIIENADSILLSLQSGAVDVFAHLTTTQIQQLGDGFHVEEGTMNLVQALYLNNAEKPFDDVRVRQALCYAIDRQQILDLAFNGYGTLLGDGFHVEEGTMNLVQALYLNNAEKPFDDVRVRQALSYAVDRQQILDLAFDGYGTLLGSSMYPAFSKYFDDELTNYYTYNTEKAKELLTEAGYPNGFDMTITVPSNYQSHMDTAQVIVEQLKAVGINAAIQPVTWESWVQDTYSNRQFQSTVVGVDASNMTARAMLERFVSTASRDFINYNNADYDTLFAQAQACYDDGEQTALYRAMEKNLAENAANVYIQDMADFVAVRDGLEGPSFYPIYVLDLSTIHYTK